MNNTAKKTILIYGIFVVILLIIFLYNSYSNKKENALDLKYYKGVNLKFNGLVMDIKPLTEYQHNVGVITIKLIKSNKNKYDPRDSLNRYIGVIKDSKLELIFNHMSSINIGDSIVFNIRDFKLYRHNKLILESSVSMPSDPIFDVWEEINSKIKL